MQTETVGGLTALSSIATADKLLVEQSGVSGYGLVSMIMPSGIISPYGGTTAPDGWLSCDGSAVSRTTYANLYTAIGTTWGVGDGSTTFNVPDLNGIFLRGAGTHGTLNKADGTDFDGGSVGDTANDKMFGHKHGLATNGANDGNEFINDSFSFGRRDANGDKYGYSGSSANENTSLVGNTVFADGTNGTPRAGDETNPAYASVKYIIKT